MLCVNFDLDGTLLLSNSIKREGFLRAARKYFSGERLMVELLLQLRGDRGKIFSRFGELAGVEKDVPALIREYSSWCEEKILRCPKRRGANDLLGSLCKAGARSYVNSATPTGSLRVLVNARFPGIFSGIFGGHGRKVPNLQAIAEDASVLPKDIVVVGDGVDDRDCAAHFGCHFIAVAGGSLEETGRTGLLDNLDMALPELCPEGSVARLKN